MNSEEAIRKCEFWTTNEAETQAWGSTRDPLVGLHFNGDEFVCERWTNPTGPRGWSISVPRWLPGRDENGEPIRTTNLAYTMIVAEIERRRVGT